MLTVEIITTLIIRQTPPKNITITQINKTNKNHEYTFKTCFTETKTVTNIRKEEEKEQLTNQNQRQNSYSKTSLSSSLLKSSLLRRDLLLSVLLVPGLFCLPSIILDSFFVRRTRISTANQADRFQASFLRLSLSDLGDAVNRFNNILFQASFLRLSLSVSKMVG